MGMIGLGDIAEKAYLPVLSARPGIDLHLMTRNQANLHRLAERYHIPKRFDNLEDLMNAGIEAAFVHASTEAHTEILQQLLDHNIHVYVDKPIDYSFSKAKETVELAKQKRKMFMVGFNRRFVPMYQQLKEIRAPQLILMEKNRVGQPDQPRKFIFDDFIHVVDTLRYLLPGPVESVQVDFRKEKGQLYHVLAHMTGGGTTAIGIMNRDSGIAEEKVEVMGAGEKRVVRNLTEMTVFRNGEEWLKRSGDWEPTLHRRGFEQTVSVFLKAVQEQQSPEPSAEDSLVTHELCEEIVERIGE